MESISLAFIIFGYSGYQYYIKHIKVLFLVEFFKEFYCNIFEVKLYSRKSIILVDKVFI